MFRYFFILNALTAFCATGCLSGIRPDFPATKGAVWPKPQTQVRKNKVFRFDLARFQIKVVGVTCTLLSNVVARYSNLYAQQSRVGLRSHDHSREHSLMTELHVDLTGPCEDYPHFGMHESYKLTIGKVSSLQSCSVWGILRGLQTVLHSFYFSDDYREILINATYIHDYPRFSHRGLLLDTSRHYISMKNILLILDAMEMNKMNVFHWHIVDDESFPYQSGQFPELSKYAAHYPTMVYSKADILLMVKYARDRGIRVIPEFDVPGHTLSWGLSHPEIVSKCVDDKGHMKGIMNPLKNATFNLLGRLVKEVQGLFPDKYFHVGGDEVNTTCWDLDPTVKAYIKGHNMSSTDLLPMFMNKLFALLGERLPIVWQDVFENMSLSDNFPVQIWKSEPVNEGSIKQYCDYNFKKTLNKVLEAGKKVILSSPWYLDNLKKGCWDYYNQTDPAAMVVNKSLLHNVLGGEACMWGEFINDRNVISRIWPRASAVAEILWSSPPFDASYNNANKNRLEEHRCRMLRHGIGAQAQAQPLIAGMTNLINYNVFNILYVVWRASRLLI